MNFTRIQSALLLTGALAASATLSSPSLRGFTTIGGSLGVATTGNGYQRDVRIQDNSTDPQSHDNNVPDASHPGALGAQLAVWKAAQAWNSNVPSAAKNFDYDWQGTTTANNPSQNTVGWGASNCGGGTLAFTEPPIADGWRIVVCPEWTWADGPGSPAGGQIDIQGVMAHELGHALGLGHAQSNFCTGSCTNRSTMCPVICSNGVSERDLAPDDAGGLQSIYGAIPGNKPTITSIGGSFQVGQTLVINGTNFPFPGTVNVKFTAGTTTNTGAIPGVVFNVATTSSNQVSVTIPAAALKGNVLIWEPTPGLLSNPFPIDVGAPPPAPPVITNVSPSQTDAFSPGLITVSGSGFTSATQVVSGGVSVGFTVVNDNSITYGGPQPSALGAVLVTVTNPFGTSNSGSFTYVETNPPELVTTGFGLTGQPLIWTFGGPASNQYFLIWGVDPTTFVYGPFNILVNFELVAIGSLDAAGLGGAQIVVPPGLTGAIVYSQVLTFDGIATILASNIFSTSIIF